MPDELLTKQDLLDLETRLTAVIRDLQADYLRSLEAMIRGNFARFHRLEEAERAMLERVNALEERLHEIEMRFMRPPQ